MHKVDKTTKSKVEAWPIDDDDALAAVLAGNTRKVTFFATCLESEESEFMMPTPTPTPGRRGSDGGGGFETLLAAAEMQEGDAEKTFILVVHLGIMKGTHGIAEASPMQIVVCGDNNGNPFSSKPTVRVINESLAEPLSRMGVKRESATLYVIYDSSLKNLSVVQDENDLRSEAAPGHPPGTERLHLAIKVIEETKRSGKLTKKAGWNPFGTGTGQDGDDYDVGDDEDADEDETSKKHRLFALVKAAWRARGFEQDIVLQSYHTQYLWRNKRGDKRGPPRQGGEKFSRVGDCEGEVEGAYEMRAKTLAGA